MTKELTQKARGIINTLLRQVTDKISRRDLTAAEKQKLNVKNGCCITVGAAAHFDSDAADRLSLGNAENSAESTSEPASKKQRKSAKKPSKVVSEMDSDSDATAKWITDDPRYSANRQIEVLFPIADGFQWFLGKITSCRRQSDRVQLSVSWETSAVPVRTDGKKTKYVWKKSAKTVTYFASSDLEVTTNAFVFEEHVYGHAVKKFAAGLFPVGCEPAYGSGRYRLMDGASDNFDARQSAEERNAHDFAYKLNEWRNANCKLPAAGTVYNLNRGIEDA